MEKNHNLILDGFQTQAAVYEFHVDLVVIHQKFPSFMECLNEQGWLMTFTKPEGRVSMFKIVKVYYSLDLVNMGYIMNRWMEMSFI